MYSPVQIDIMTTNTKFCLSFLFHQLTRSSDPGVNLTLAHDIQLLIAFIGFPGKFKDTSFFIALNYDGAGGSAMNNNILFHENLFHVSPRNDRFQFHMKMFLAKITHKEKHIYYRQPPSAPVRPRVAVNVSTRHINCVVSGPR